MSESTELLTYYFPLRPDLRVEVMLPGDLSTTESDRLAVFLNSLTFDEATR